MSGVFKRIPFGPIAEVVAAALAMLGLMKGFPGAGNDLGVDVGEVPGAIVFGISEARNDCVLEIELASEASTPLIPTLAGEDLMVRNLDDSGRRFRVEGEASKGWSWRSYDDLELKGGDGDLENWILMCRSGTDSMGKQGFRRGWWGLTGGLYGLGILLSVLGAWRKGRKPDEGAAPTTVYGVCDDALNACIEDIEIPGMGEDEKRALKEILRAHILKGVPLFRLRPQVRSLGPNGEGYRLLKLAQGQILDNRNKLISHMQRALSSAPRSRRSS